MCANICTRIKDTITISTTIVITATLRKVIYTISSISIGEIITG